MMFRLLGFGSTLKKAEHRAGCKAENVPIEVPRSLAPL